ncbi:MAG: YbaB/EbfC family nucleoid-associated protein [Desulfovibrio sp.]|nr:YbaB/EbfC family nucleoid-associated protein [Desulfovibrio sp.]
MPNMNDILRQAQIMQRKLSKAQEDLAAKTYEASSGGGMVKVTVSGNYELKSLVIDPKVMADGDVEMLQDLIVAAVNEAGRIAKETMEREMGALSGGLKIPGLFS